MSQNLLRCVQCDAAPPAGAASCPRCAGRIVKPCPECRFHNSPAKNYCDSCGTPLRRPDPAPEEPSPRHEPPTGPKDPDKDREIPRTEVFLFEARPPASRRASRPAVPASGVPQAPDKARRPPARPWISLALAAVLLASGAGVLFLRWRSTSTPEAALLRAAHLYLQALQESDFQAAREQLTRGARAAASVEELRAARPAGDWRFSGLGIERLDGQEALLRCALLGSDGSTRRLRLAWAYEDGRWARPFVGQLLRRVETALERQDAQEAWRLAREAEGISPREPALRPYLCEAAYYGGRAQDAERYCRAALDSSDADPRLRWLLADTYKHALDRPGDALREYKALLASRAPVPAERCELNLAVAELELSGKDHAEALKAFREAEPSCTKPQDLAYLRLGTRVLSGQAGGEAVGLAQGYRLRENGPTLLEWRRELRRELGRQARSRGAPRTPPERWSAGHLGGLEYRVTLSAESSVILTAKVNPWTGTVVEVQARPAEAP